MPKYRVTLHTEKPLASEQALKAWAGRMQREFKWDTDFEVLKQGVTKRPVDMNGDTVTTVTVEVVQ